MNLQEFRDIVPGSIVQGDAGVFISGITHDSRAVRPGDLFISLVGERFDGHNYLAGAIERGAAAVVVETDRVDLVPKGTPCLVVANTRVALPQIASAFHAYPTRRLKLVGVTGTNGKTTTALLVASIFKAAGEIAGTVGTLGSELMGRPIPSEHTTPESDQLQAIFAKMLMEGATAVAMEVSSHALAQGRVVGCEFDAAVFTNLTQDHLDFHGTMENYFEAKMRLFEEYPAVSGKPFVAAVNLDDPRGAVVADRVKGKVVSYSVVSPADVMATDVQLDALSTRFRCKSPDGGFDVQLPIGGAFQVHNALASIAAAVGLGVPLSAIQAGLAAMPGVPGRFESVPTGRGFACVVDYAHSPDGLENLLAAARRLNPSRIIVVFGCGGNRDRTKRPIMGRMAGAQAEVAIVTSDNPRHEEPDAIIQEILEGMKGATAKVLVQPDRRRAIEMALSEATVGDIVLIAGKGHEDYQIVGDEVLPFDDRKVAREILGAGG